MNSAGKWRKLFSFAYVALLCLWLVGYIYLLARLLWRQEFFFSSGPAGVYYCDFARFYVYTKLAGSSQAAFLYDPQVQLEWFNQLIAPLRVHAVVFLQYPPFFFSLFSPLAALPILPAYVIYLIGSLLLAVGGLALIWRTDREKGACGLYLLCAGMLASVPSWMNLRDGQLGLWLVGLISLYYHWLCGRRNDFLAGALLAVLSCKLQYAPFLGAAALALGRYRLILAAVLTEIVLLSWSATMVGWRNIFHYPKMLMSIESHSLTYLVNPEQMACLRAFICQLLPERLVMPVCNMLMLAGAALVFFTFQSRAKNGCAAYFRWAFAVSVILLLVASPHSGLYDCVLLSIPAALTLPSLDPFSAWKEKDKLLKWWSLTLLLYPLAGCFLFFWWDSGHWGESTFNPLALANIFLLVLGMAKLARWPEFPAQ